MIAEVNPQATYWIFDNGFLERAIKIYFGLTGTKYVYCPTQRDDWKNWGKDNAESPFEKYQEKVIYNGMKFDLIIGNPPYDKSLHLKILKKAMEYCDFDNGGEIVWLSPVRWLQDPLAEDKKASDYKRYKDSICRKLKNVDVLNASDANNTFGIQNFTDLAVYTLDNNGGYDHKAIIDKYLGVKRSIFEKVYPFCCKHNFSDKIVYNLKGISVKFNDLFGGHSNPYTLVTTNHSHPYIDGKTEDGRTYAQCAFKKKDVDENKQAQSTVKFQTVDEAKNFIKTVQTNFMMFVNSCTKRDVHVALMALPWMGDAVNPRTGLKGYAGEWTDEDFFDYFGLTEDERKLVKDTMEKCKAK